MPKGRKGRHAGPGAMAMTVEEKDALLERLRRFQDPDGADAALEELGGQLPVVAANASQLAEDDAASVLAAAAALAHRPQFAEAATTVLVALRTPAAADSLRALAGEATDRTVIKAARRALHQLASLGVATEAPPLPAGTAVFRPLSEGIAWQSAMVTPFDNSGGRTILLARAALPVGGNICMALTNERQGLFFFDFGRPTHRQLEKQWGQFKTLEGETRTVEIPFGYGQWLLSEAAELRAAGGSSPLDEYVSWQETIGGPPEGTSPRLIYDELDVDPGADNTAALDRGATLLTEPELETWSLPLESMTSFGVELLQARNSPIVLSEAAQAEREQAVFARAAREQIPPESRQHYKRRLEETALLFSRTERQEQGRTALATAIALGQEDRDLGTVPFVIALVRRAVEAAGEVAAPASEAGREAMTRLYADRE